MLKLDVEGAEIELVPALVSSNASALVDVLLWECHYCGAKVCISCHKLHDRMLAAGVGLIYREPYSFHTNDTRNRRKRMKHQAHTRL